MLNTRWTYENDRGLTQWYGHVEYYGDYIVGQWFVLDADTGQEYWSRSFLRANTVCGVSHHVIIASETRSDGPWTLDFGIYGIDAKTGSLLWTNHGRGLWGKLFRCFDHVPGFTNDFRDAPEHVVGEYVLTARNRILDVRTGHERRAVQLEAKTTKRSRAEQFYDNNTLLLGKGDRLKVEGPRDDFSIFRVDKDGLELWRFSARERSLYCEGNYYSYRLNDDRIYIILGDAPKYVPVKPGNPGYVKPNPANYQLGVLDVASGECTLCPLEHAEQRTECRIETIRDARLLVSCGARILTEYAIAT